MTSGPAAGLPWQGDDVEVRDGFFRHGCGHALVFTVAPRTVFGFCKGEPFHQTRWRFD